MLSILFSASFPDLREWEATSCLQYYIGEAYFFGLEVRPTLVRGILKRSTLNIFVTALLLGCYRGVPTYICT